MPKLRLITVAVSHYCEKARWALDRADIGYVEERHAPMMHWLSTGRWARSRTVPVLVTPHGTLRDSTDILRFASNGGARLYPDEASARWEDTLDEKLGPYTRRWAYAWATEDPHVFRELVSQGVEGAERKVVDVGHGALRRAMRRAFRLDAPGVKERTVAQVRAVFDEVAAALGDRRGAAGAGGWLTGDVFTAADLTLAALAAPILLPPGYGAWLPSVDAMPKEAGAIVRELRATPAGELAMRAYGEQRRVKAS